MEKDSDNEFLFEKVIYEISVVKDLHDRLNYANSVLDRDLERVSHLLDHSLDQK